METFRPIESLMHLEGLLAYATQNLLFDDLSADDVQAIADAAAAQGLPAPGTYSPLHITLHAPEDMFLRQACALMMVVDAYKEGRIDEHTFFCLTENFLLLLEVFIDHIESGGDMAFPCDVSVGVEGNA